MSSSSIGSSTGLGVGRRSIGPRRKSGVGMIESGRANPDAAPGPEARSTPLRPGSAGPMMRGPARGGRSGRTVGCAVAAWAGCGGPTATGADPASGATRARSPEVPTLTCASVAPRTSRSVGVVDPRLATGVVVARTGVGREVLALLADETTTIGARGEGCAAGASRPRPTPHPTSSSGSAMKPRDAARRTEPIVGARARRHHPPFGGGDLRRPA